MLTLDGSYGEGGGQILRSALGLSLVTGTGFSIHSIRARRKRPGLLRQHLTAVQAAQQIGAAEVAGAALSSRELVFEPVTVQPGAYRFAIGTAGSCTLVLQTVLPALALADGPSTLTLEGGTHNPMAPPFEFLRLSLQPQLARCGVDLHLELVRPGFFPAGGGELRAVIQPAQALKPFELLERGAEVELRARAYVAELPVNIARRELQVVKHTLIAEERKLRAEELRGSPGPGNVLSLELCFDEVTEVCTGFGMRGVRAEEVARRAVREAKKYLATDAPVGEHLADQLLVPLALAGGGAFRTVEPSAHTRTNAFVVEQFLPVRIEFTEEEGRGSWRVEVQGR